MTLIPAPARPQPMQGQSARLLHWWLAWACYGQLVLCWVTLLLALGAAGGWRVWSQPGSVVRSSPPPSLWRLGGYLLGSVLLHGLLLSLVPRWLDPAVAPPVFGDPIAFELWEEAPPSEVTSSDIASAEATNPETTSPELPHSEMTSSEVTNPEGTRSEILSPETASAETTSPEISSSNLTNPDLTSPEVTNPETTNPDISSQETTEAEPVNAANPVMTSPPATTPATSEQPTPPEPENLGTERPTTEAIETETLETVPPPQDLVTPAAAPQPSPQPEISPLERLTRPESASSQVTPSPAGDAIASASPTDLGTHHERTSPEPQGPVSQRLDRQSTAEETAASPQPGEANPANQQAALPPPVPDQLARPRPASQVPPDYPEALRRRQIEGQVTVRVSVSAQGDVVAVAIAQSSGFGDLDREAVRAVQRWQFDPARRNGEPIAATVQVPIRFALRDL